MKKEEYRVSKFLTSAFLITPDELQKLLDELGDICIFPTGSLLVDPKPISKKEWIEEYSGYILEGKKLSPALLTYKEENVYPFEARSGQFLFYPRYPVMQVQHHQFAVTSDNRIHSMVFGPGATQWGIIISYPQIFFDPVTKKIIEPFKDLENPNTVGFRKLQKWVRDFTKPASFMIGGKKVNATFRVGKEWTQEVCMTS